jgi:DNA invertase Pin-like site-specific DNA recombinase
MGDLLGYARVSTTEQKAHLQTDALKKAGCIRVWTDKASGALDHRPKLEAVLDHLRPGDTLVVWRLDRLGRSLRHLIDTVNGLAEDKVGFRSLTESIDTTTSGGKLAFHFFGALAEFERDLVRERTMARQLRQSGEHTMADIARMLGVSRASVYRHLAGPSAGPAPAATTKRTRHRSVPKSSKLSRQSS